MREGPETGKIERKPPSIVRRLIPMNISRRKFLQTSFAGAVLGSGSLSATGAIPEQPLRLIRLTGGSYGGTSCYRFGSIARKLAGVEQAQMHRDWSQKCNSFQIATSRPLEDILCDMQDLQGECVTLEIPRRPIDLPHGELPPSILPRKVSRSGDGRERQVASGDGALHDAVEPLEWLEVGTSHFSPPRRNRRGEKALRSANRTDPPQGSGI